MPTAENNRKTTRVAAPNVMVRVSSVERFRSAYLKDMSEGGLFIKTEKPLPIGKDVVIDLLPPGFTVPLRLPAKVVRHGDPAANGMGVKFLELEPETAEAIRALIATYSLNPASAEQDSGASTTAGDLEVLLEQFGILKSSLEERDKELARERERHQEASRRALKLSDELEALRNKPEDAPRREAGLELHVALAEKDAELTGARIRIADLEHGLEAYQKEVQVLEEDDSNSRRLAGSLAQERLGMAREVERLAAELDQERKNAADRLKEVASRLEKTDSAAKETIQKMQAEFEARQQSLSQQGGRASALEAQLAEQVARQASFDAELRTLRTENVTLAARLKSAESAAKDTTAKLERLKTKERELRRLLETIAGRTDAARADDDEVVIDEGEAPSASGTWTAAVPAAPPPLPAPAAVAAEPKPIPLQAVAVSVPPPDGAPESTEDALPQEFEVEEASLEMPIDESALAATPMIVLTSTDFEFRLRANEELKTCATFEEHTSSDEVVTRVKGLVRNGARFAELMVLGRGVVTPPQLLDVLFKLHQAGLVNFR